MRLDQIVFPVGLKAIDKDMFFTISYKYKVKAIRLVI
jgi:hypothetical protein